MKFNLERSPEFPHKPNETFYIDHHGTMFEIDMWHLATYKGGHSMRFAVRNHAFELYFSESGRVVHFFPVDKRGVQKLDDQLAASLEKTKGRKHARK